MFVFTYINISLASQHPRDFLFVEKINFRITRTLGQFFTRTIKFPSQMKPSAITSADPLRLSNINDHIEIPGFLEKESIIEGCKAILNYNARLKP